jgi:hypothetical protein
VRERVREKMFFFSFNNRLLAAFTCVFPFPPLSSRRPRSFFLLLLGEQLWPLVFIIRIRQGTAYSYLQSDRDVADGDSEAEPKPRMHGENASVASPEDAHTPLAKWVNDFGVAIPTCAPRRPLPRKCAQCRNRHGAGPGQGWALFPLSMAILRGVGRG